ncbi:MAG TPA: hypothetical protein VKY74_22510, partial [Chloroflexia bacterium]|nr:hypothetical protein [Chloroflexia bacterium]
MPVSREVRALGRTLIRPRPWAGVLLVALAAIGLAYQVRPPYPLSFGSRTDAAFWRQVNGGEQDPTTHATYRWTTATSVLTLPGVGTADYRVRVDLSGGRPPGFPPPDLVISVGPTEIAHLHPVPTRQTYELLVPAPVVAAAQGDLPLTFRTRNPFSPPGDPRQLGVAVFGLTAVAGEGGLVAPPLRTGLLLAGAAGLIVLLLGLAGWGPGVQLAGGLVWVAAEAGFLVADRLWLTPIPGTLVGVLLAAGGGLLLLGPLWRLLYRAGGIPWPEPDQRWLLGIYAAAFVARLAGQLHPQTVVIDLIFHQHRLEQVLGGQLLFTIKSDEWGGRETFYLPTPYLFMRPLQWLLNDELLTIRVFTVALDTLGVFLVYYLARRAFADGRAGLLAAGLQVTLPLAVLPFSWGITANLFGQFAGLAAVTLAVGCFDRLTRPGPWLLLVAVLTAAFLSHPGSVQLSGLLIGGLLVAWGLGV